MDEIDCYMLNTLRLCKLWTHVVETEFVSCCLRLIAPEHTVQHSTAAFYVRMSN